MKMFRNRLLVPLFLIAVLAAVLGANVCSASSFVRKHTATTTGSTLKPGVGPFTGEPDASGGTGAPLPKTVPTGAAAPANSDPDPADWSQVWSSVTSRFWTLIRMIRG